MYTELVDLDYQALDGVIKVHDSLVNERITPIINSLIERFNESIKSGNVASSHEWKKYLSIWTNKHVIVNTIRCVFEEENFKNIDCSDVTHQLRKIFSKKYPNALLDISWETPREKNYSIYYIGLSFREDGKPLSRD